MACENCVNSEKIVFIGLSAVLKTLDSNMKVKVSSVANIDRSKKRGKFQKTTNGVYMV